MVAAAEAEAEVEVEAGKRNARRGCSSTPTQRSAYYGTRDPERAASPGGFLRVVEGRIVGAIGCSGGTGDRDVVVLPSWHRRPAALK
ncbi:heme-binding protein [Methylorubrum sp. Q1]|uniref:heme-binding protein n=1 Tax=Methylorubrum sp. Q1 TaxID=2562453 RepID=UPI001AED79BA